MGSIIAWLNRPVTTQGNAWQVFLSIGFILVCIALWRAAARDFSLMERD